MDARAASASVGVDARGQGSVLACAYVSSPDFSSLRPRGPRALCFEASAGRPQRRGWGRLAECPSARAAISPGLPLGGGGRVGGSRPWGPRLPWLAGEAATFYASACVTSFMARLCGLPLVSR